LLACLVLILFRVEFEIEQAGQISAGAPATASTSSAPITERHLNVTERRFGTQEMRQCPLLRPERVLPLHGFELVGSGLHLGGASLHVLQKRRERLIRSRQFAAGGALRERFSLLLQLLLDFGKELGIFSARRTILGTAADRVPGSRDDFFLTPRNLFLVL